MLVEPIWIRLGQMRTKCEDTVAILPKVNNPNHPAHWQKKEKKRNLIKQQHRLCYLQLPGSTAAVHLFIGPTPSKLPRHVPVPGAPPGASAKQRNKWCIANKSRQGAVCPSSVFDET